MTVVAETPDRIVITRSEAAEVEHHIERLEEALYDAQRLLAQDSAGWALMTSGTQDFFSAEHLRQVRQLAAVMSVADPLIRRAVSLHVAFMWSGGVSLTAEQEKNAQQDVNQVIQDFVDDPKVRAVVTGPAAHEARERALKTEGEYFMALPTSPLSGRVRPRRVPGSEIKDIITNPEDSVEVWYYERTYVQRSIVSTTGSTSRVQEETVTVYYPDVAYRPAQRPRYLNGHQIRWDAPMLSLIVNASAGGRGIPDLYAALPWAQGYKGFLQDWAGLVKALSRLAFKVTSKTPRGQSQARGAFAARPVGADGQVGQTVITGEGSSIEAIGKSGATIDSNSGRPLAAMVASATDVPVTMLLADPGVTGARATAETLDRPFYETVKVRQSLHAGFLLALLNYVVQEAIRAPRGALRGTIGRDPLTGDEVATLRNDQPISVQVEFPKLDRADVGTMMEAIAKADGIDKLPPELLARLAMLALGVDDVDTWLEKIVDADGNFISPADTSAATDQQNAVAGGDVPPN